MGDVVFDNALDALMLTAPDGRIFSANAAACRLLGRSEEEICRGGRAAIIVHDERALAFVQERTATGRARGELLVRRADGTTFVAEVTSVVFATADGPRTSLSMRDITDLRRSERALTILAGAGRLLVESLEIDATLQKLTSVLVPTLGDLCTIDLLVAGEVRRVAAAHRDPSRLEEVRSIRRSNVASGEGVDRVLATGQPKLVRVMTDAFLRDAAHDAAHLERGRALGITSMIIAPLIARGHTLGAFTVASTGGVATYDERDLDLAVAIAERAALALDNARQHTAMARATRLRDETLSAVSHDLGNPLNVALLSVGLLAKRHGDPELAMLHRAIDRARDLARDLVLAAKAELHELPLERKPESVREIVRDVVDLREAEASAKGLVIDADVVDCPVSVDRRRIIQMLDNLVANAIKFTGVGAVVVRARVEANSLSLEVRDTGPGIAPNELAHVFDRFWQSSHTRRAGAGLGLAIARGIARAHGGDIIVSSALGHGASFIATLPA